MTSKSSSSKQYWLMKSEPDVYSIDDLQRDGTTLWEGVRNYQARNFMMKQMNKGDLVLFYHSNAHPPGVAGIAEVASDPLPDPTQFNPDSPYFAPKAKKDSPSWYCVKVKYVKKLAHLVSLPELRALPELEGLELLRKGNRLSIQPVSEREFRIISGLGH